MTNSRVHPVDDAGSTEERESALRRQIEALTQLNRELAFARDVAEAASRAKSEFLATVSHEVRTPMQGLIGALDLLGGSMLSGDQADLVESAQSSGNSLLALVNDIVDFAASETSRSLAEPAPFDLQRTVEDVAARFATRAERKNIEVIVQYAAETPRQVTGDVEHVRTVLLQVVDNAVRFTDRGHVLIAVDTPVATDNDLLARVVVQDTGTGIPAERLPLIFSRYDSSARRGDATPAGSGLAVARQIAERMGGTIIASSHVGEGSTFTITFRLARAFEGADAPATSPLAGVHALVVDDVSLHRMVMHRQMTGFDMRVETAADGATALQMARDAAEAGDPYRLLLIDQNMPGMSGEQLGRAVRQDAALQGVAMMLFTATVEREEMRKFARAGFDGYFIKPIRPSELQEALVAVLQSRRRGGTRLSVVPAAAVPAPQVVAGSLANRHVLLVEDNTINQKVGRRMLEALGCRVDVAVNGLEAVKLWSGGVYDVVFMDCDMPVMNGFDATREIRRNEADHARRTPIVALTANALPSDRERCLAAGMDDFVAKPVREDALHAVMSAVLGVAA